MKKCDIKMFNTFKVLFINIFKYYRVPSITACRTKKNTSSLPKDFVIVTDVVPSVILEMRYHSTNNFVGESIDGYNAPVAILTKEAANALKYSSDILAKQGYALKIWDAYRPQSAVDHFLRWAKDIEDQKMKETFYRDIDKKDLFEFGYISNQSSHTRGSTVDLTLVDVNTGKEVDMGSSFDVFGEISYRGTTLINEEQTRNREILKITMKKAGFKYYKEEWWHYTLKDEPYEYTYFNFPINYY